MKINRKDVTAVIGLTIGVSVLIGMVIISIPSPEEMEVQRLKDIDLANSFCREQGYYSIDEGGVNYVMGTDGSKFVRCMYEDGHLSDYKNFNGGGLSYKPILTIVMIAGIIIGVLIVYNWIGDIKNESFNRV